MAMKCGCKIKRPKVRSPLLEKARVNAGYRPKIQYMESRPIDFCPLHAAAPEMLAALKEAQYLAGAMGWHDPENANRNVKECRRIQTIIKEIIAKTEGKP